MVQNSFKIESSSGSYTVEVGSNLIARALREHPHEIVLCDTILAPYLPPEVSDPIFINALESNKSLEML